MSRMASQPAAGAAAVLTCAVPDEVVDAFKKFKSRKNPANCAIILAINKNDLIVEIEDTLEVKRKMGLAETKCLCLSIFDII